MIIAPATSSGPLSMRHAPPVRHNERPALAAVLTSAGRESMRAAREYGYTVAEIAAYLRISPATAYRQLRA